MPDLFHLRGKARVKHQTETHQKLMNGESILAYRPTEVIRSGSNRPVDLRFVRRDGRLILQSGHEFTEYAGGQVSGGGFEWRDIPTVDE